MPTCTLVLGTPRSGTSLVAGILHHLGVFMGERFLPANEMNLRGFYQDIEFEEVFDNWHPDWMPEYPCSTPAPIGLSALIERRQSLGCDWGAKFTRVAFALPAFPTPKLIVTQRPREQSVASMARWTGGEDQSPEEIIDRAADAIQRASDGFPNLIADYAELLADPLEGVRRIAAFVGRNPTTEAVRFVDPELQRFK